MCVTSIWLMYREEDHAYSYAKDNFSRLWSFIDSPSTLWSCVSIFINYYSKVTECNIIDLHFYNLQPSSENLPRDNILEAINYQHPTPPPIPTPPHIFLSYITIYLSHAQASEVTESNLIVFITAWFKELRKWNLHRSYANYVRLNIAWFSFYIIEVGKISKRCLTCWDSLPYPNRRPYP